MSEMSEFQICFKLRRVFVPFRPEDEHNFLRYVGLLV